MLSTSAFIALAMQCAASVHPDTAHEVARVESGFNPYGVSLEIGNFCTLSALFNQSWFVRG